MKFANPADLYGPISRSWSAATVGDSFDPSNPCRGQCAVTALAVQRFFGGEIVKTPTTGGTHFYNRIGDAYWDLATDQFDKPIPYLNLPSSADEAHQHATREQLDALLRNVERQCEETR